MSSAPLATHASAGSRKSRPILFTAAAVAALVVVVAGFARTYYAKAAFGTRELDALMHAHGAVMTLWFTMLLVQVRLVAANRVQWHRRLGIAGAVVAALVLVVGTATAIAAAKAGRTPGPPPLVFLAIPLGDMVVFATLIGAAFWMRKRADYHKRFMVAGSLGILTAAIARIPLDAWQAGGLPLFFAATDVLLIGFIATDAIRQRRLHPAFAWGLGIVVLSQAARFAIAGTPQWAAFAGWLVR
jgi:hypothetical protein